MTGEAKAAMGGGTVPQSNDLYLIEPAASSEAYQISRRHCDIEHENGHFFLLDSAGSIGPRRCARLSARRSYPCSPW